MLSILKEALGGLFKWGMLALALVFLFKIIIAAIPALSQDSIKSAVVGDVSSEKGKNWFKLPYPGSGAFNIFNIGGGFKYKAVQAPTINDYTNRDTDISNSNIKQNPNIGDYEIQTYNAQDNQVYDYSSYNRTQNYNGGRTTTIRGGTNWNQRGTNWNAAQTDWNNKQTDWSAGQTNWAATQTDWSAGQTNWNN